ncbi:MAG: DUF3253 domain-containing protein [Maricaulis sp.]|uniref:DUF3253 domain-containing protein n=1 Tax=Maricaulis sp. TaxID=1486257 RepID=UPI00260525DC|nr:DUF3253 domain-containing protein [Maricaulis sp.]MDM7983402.1 DUF3253 domain-containing protein [Maricaulis sp.]
MSEMSEENLNDPFEDAIRKLVAEVKEGRNVSPADVAKLVDPDNHTKRFGHVRQAAVRLHKAGEIAILRKGKPVPDADAFKGVYRLGRV